jgi:hypothetical protein
MARESLGDIYKRSPAEALTATLATGYRNTRLLWVSVMGTDGRVRYGGLPCR